MYHLIVYTIKPDVNAKLLLRSIAYICDPVHLYCIASITEEASATSRDPVCQSSIQEEILTLRTEENIGIYNLQVVATDTGGESTQDTLVVAVRQHHLSRTFHHEFTASLAMVEPDSWQYALDWKLSALRSRPEPTRAASPSSRWPIRAPARSGSTGPTTPPSPRLLCPGPRPGVKRTRCSRSVSEEYKLHLRRVKEHQVTFNNAKLVRSFTHTLLLQAQAVRRGRAAAGHLMEEFQAQRYSGSLLPFFCYYTALSSFSGRHGCSYGQFL